MSDVIKSIVTYIHNNKSAKILVIALLILSLCLVSLTIGKYIGGAIYQIFG